MCLSSAPATPAAPRPDDFEFFDRNGALVPEGTRGAQKRRKPVQQPTSILGDSFMGGQDGGTGSAAGAAGGEGVM